MNELIDYLIIAWYGLSIATLAACVFLFFYVILKKNIIYIGLTLIIFLGFSPIFVSFYKLGSLGWFGSWCDEVLAWSLILSILLCLPIYVGYNNFKLSPIINGILMASALNVIVWSWPQFILDGFKIETCAKGVSEELELLSFWSSKWWE